MRYALGLLILAGCGPVKPDVVEVPVTKFVPIDSALLVPCAIATGPLSEVIQVARDRKAALEVCNAQLEAIRELQPQP